MTTLRDDERARIRGAVLSQIEAELQTRGRSRLSAGRRLRRPGLVLAGGTLLATVGAGSATAVVLHPRTVAAAPTHSARCYGEVSRDRGEGFPGTTVVVGNAGVDLSEPPATEDDWVPVCAELWQYGVLPQRDHQPLPDEHAHHPVPALVACVDDTGEVSVFPGDASVCNSVGLALDWNSSPRPTS